MSRITRSITTIAIFTLLLAAPPLAAQQTNNSGLRAVPAPGKVTVDGKVNDWDTSGEILACPDVSKELDRHTARVAAMYDKDMLYLSFRFADETPLVNHIDPRSAPGEGWRGDSVEIRMALGDRSIHWQMYYWTPERKPIAQFFYGGTGGESRVIPLGLQPAGEGQSPERGEPGAIYDGLACGVQEAFTVHEDGGGYTQEMAVPWKLLTRDGLPLKAGDSMKMGLQFNWGDASGGHMTGMPRRRYEDLINPEHPQRSFFYANVKAWGTLELVAEGNVEPSPSTELPSLVEQLQRMLYSTSGPVAVEYTLPADGYATLVIEKPDGTRVRNLISDYPRTKGKNIDYWDGCDDTGRLMSPGEYRLRGLFHEALDVKYEFSFGNPAPVPWATVNGNGGWLSNHCNHLGILADEDRIYVSAPESEGPYPLIALDYDGNQVWGGLARWYAGYLARSGLYLYTVNDRKALPARSPEELDKLCPIELIRLDPQTGREVPFPDGSSKHTIAEWSLYKQGAAKKWQGWTAEHAAFNADWAGINPQGLAAMDGTLYVSLHFDNKLLKVGAETGKVVAEIPLEKPAGLVSDGKRLLAVSGTQVVQVDPASGGATPVVTDHLKAPIDLAVDSRGNLYVSDWADQMCVKVFSPKGEYLRVVGEMGGRPWVGPYNCDGMLLPRGISIDARDRLWVAEYTFSPRRVSCWDTQTGKLLIEKVGRGGYGGMGYYVMPDQPDKGIYLNCLLDLDWDRGRWRVRSTLWNPTEANQVVGYDPYTRFGRIIHHQGRRLVIHSSMRFHNGVVVVSELTADGKALPLAALGPVWSAMERSTQVQQGGVEQSPILADHLWTEPLVNQAARRVIPWAFQGPSAGDHRPLSRYFGQALDEARKMGLEVKGRPQTNQPNANFVWSDLNGDGGIDDDEIAYFATPGLQGPLPEAWAPESWSGGVAGDDLAMYLTAVQDKKSYHFRLPVARWTEKGVPVYEPQQAQLIVASPYMGQAAWLSEQGDLLTLGNLTGNFASRDPLVMYRPDGSIAWTFPSPWTGVHGSHTALKEKRGQLVGPLGVFGEARLDGVGEIFAFHTNVGTAEFFTADGLYLGRLFRDTRSAPDPWPDQPRRGQSLNNMTPGGEWFGGQFFQRPEGTMYVICGRPAGVIGHVTGLETTRRLAERSIVFTAEHYAVTRTQMANAAGDRQQVKTMQVTPLKQAAGVPALKAFHWDAQRSAAWRYDEARSAEATWGYDKENLYVAFQVQDTTPMVNSGEDARRLFKFGDAAVLELRTDPDQESRQAAQGDLRLLFSVHQGQPVAVLYDYVHPGAKEPVELTSVKTTRIDRLDVLKNAKVAIDRTADGYTLRAAVPLRDLGWEPQPGKTYPGDFGIVYSDKTGQINELRMYWSNQATGLVSDLSLEADIQPTNWGRFEMTR